MYQVFNPWSLTHDCDIWCGEDRSRDSKKKRAKIVWMFCHQQTPKKKVYQCSTEQWRKTPGCLGGRDGRCLRLLPLLDILETSIEAASILVMASDHRHFTCEIERNSIHSQKCNTPIPITLLIPHSICNPGYMWSWERNFPTCFFLVFQLFTWIFNFT